MNKATSPHQLLFLFIVLLCGACKKNKSAEDTPDNRTYAIVRTESNVAYGTNERQKMDVYFPEEYSSSTPVVFLIHGGGFIAGSKEAFTAAAHLYTSRGFISVNISHRLVNGTGLDQFPPPHIASSINVVHQVEDIAAAVEKYKTAASDWGSGTSKMYMAGHSAGGTLAMLYVQGEKNTGKAVKASGNLAGLANLTLATTYYENPPQHLLWPNIKELLYRLSGAEVTQNNALHLMAISPNWVSNLNEPGMPNITIMPESNDEDLQLSPYLTSVIDAKNYHEQLKGKGVNSEFVMMNTDHGFGNNPDDWSKAINYTIRFFRKIN